MTQIPSNAQRLAAEFLGTFTLIVFGCGVVAHFVLRNAVGDPAPAPNTFGDFTWRFFRFSNQGWRDRTTNAASRWSR